MRYDLTRVSVFDLRVLKAKVQQNLEAIDRLSGQAPIFRLDYCNKIER